MVQILYLALASTEVRCKLANQSASLDLTFILSSAGFPTGTSTFGKYLRCTAMFVHSSAVKPHCHQLQYDDLYATPVSYNITTKKHGIGHTQHRERALKIVYVLSRTHSTTALQLCQTFLHLALLLKKNYLF